MEETVWGELKSTVEQNNIVALGVMGVRPQKNIGPHDWQY
jgi:hypothetical protein